MIIYIETALLILENNHQMKVIMFDTSDQLNLDIINCSQYLMGVD